ncbi:MAG: hypothetical protein AAF810_27535 [Cyanobacteria bacterium P01_D01_bin.36]
MFNVLFKFLNKSDLACLDTTNNQDSDKAKLRQLAQLQISIVIGLSVIVPLFAYAYTARWQACLRFFIVSFLVGGCALQVATKENYNLKLTKTLLSAGFIAVAATENSLAISNARKELN